MKYYLRTDKILLRTLRDIKITNVKLKIIEQKCFGRKIQGSKFKGASFWQEILSRRKNKGAINL